MSFDASGSGSEKPPRPPGDFPRDSGGEPPGRNTLFRLFAFVAAIALTVFSASLFVSYSADGTNLETRIGEQKTYRLVDGSTITLNTDSQVRSRADGMILRVEILKGEALFKIRHNPHRILIVLAGNAAVTDTSTVFAVRRVDNDESRVVIEEGEVQLQAGKAQLKVSQNQQGTVRPEANQLRIEVRNVSAAEVARRVTSSNSARSRRHRRL